MPHIFITTMIPSMQKEIKANKFKRIFNNEDRVVRVDLAFTIFRGFGDFLLLKICGVNGAPDLKPCQN